MSFWHPKKSFVRIWNWVFRMEFNWHFISIRHYLVNWNRFSAAYFQPIFKRFANVIPDFLLQILKRISKAHLPQLISLFLVNYVLLCRDPCLNTKRFGAEIDISSVTVKHTWADQLFSIALKNRNNIFILSQNKFEIIE